MASACCPAELNAWCDLHVSLSQDPGVHGSPALKISAKGSKQSRPCWPCCGLGSLLAKICSYSEQECAAHGFKVDPTNVLKHLEDLRLPQNMEEVCEEVLRINIEITPGDRWILQLDRRSN